MSDPGKGPSLPKKILLVPLVLLYVAAGINHFVNPHFYEAIMPPYLPAHRELVLLSGAIEVALGVLVAIPATRRLAAWGLVLLLLAVFPANLHMAMADVGEYGWISWARLPLQLPLIAWAWWYTKKD